MANPNNPNNPSSCSQAVRRSRPIISRDNTRFYTRPPKGRVNNLPILNNYNKKELENLEIGEIYKYCQNFKHQVLRDKREKQLNDNTKIEWYHGIRQKKYFHIVNIEEGSIPGISPCYNGVILTLKRVE